MEDTTGADGCRVDGGEDNSRPKIDILTSTSCKKEVVRTRLGHVLLQGCLAWMDEAQLGGHVNKSAES